MNDPFRLDDDIVNSAAQELVDSMSTGSMSSTAYDTGAIAALREPNGAGPGRVMFPDSLRWLREHQHPDGSWGGHIPMGHDRVVSTLAAVATLVDRPAEHAAVRRGIAYLTERGDAWRNCPHETVGFELIVPTLVDRLAGRGFRLPKRHFAGLSEVRRRKLSLLQPLATAVRSASFAHSLEALGDRLTDDDLRGVETVDGSVGCSPSATAYLWSRTGSPRALEHLRRVASAHPDGGIPNVIPIDVSERAWSLYAMQEAGLRPPGGERHLDHLHDALTEGGVGYARGLGTPDSDDTAMVINVLHRAGRPVDHLVPLLLKFERESHFACFHVERDPSVTANARVLEVLARDRRYRSGADKVVSFLAEQRLDGAYWLDKWHASPYYATSHVVAAARSYAPWLLAGTRDWLLSTARPDGSWGWFRGTLEETAYGIFALHWLAGPDGDDPAVIAAAAAATRYLAEHTQDGLPPRYTSALYPPLWVGKGMFSLTIYCRALVLAAMVVGRRLCEPIASW